jgi:hypothetical protein
LISVEKFSVFEINDEGNFEGVSILFDENVEKMKTKMGKNL